MSKNSLFEQRIQDALGARRREKTLLTPPTPAPPDTIDFASNDILSLSSSGALTKAFLRELAQNPDFAIASPGGRVGGGPSAYLTQLEEHIAAVHGAESATYFTSGYDANVAVWTALPAPVDVIVHDAAVHASTYDGMRASRAARSARIAFAHDDCDSFRESLEAAKARFPGAQARLSHRRIVLQYCRRRRPDSPAAPHGRGGASARELRVCYRRGALEWAVRSRRCGLRLVLGGRGRDGGARAYVW
jgi:8-amino-7-oxononanoate synthase